MISALCLAVGIVVFSLAYLFVDRMADAYSRLPEHERRVRIMAFTKETGGDMPFALADVDELLFRTEGILDSVSVHSATMRTDADVIGKDGSSLPYIVRYKVTNSSFSVISTCRCCMEVFCRSRRMRLLFRLSLQKR